MTILKIIEALQSYSEDVLAYKLDGGFANAVTEAVSLLISQGEQIADLQNELRDERYRHDRVQDFEVAEAEALRQVKAERDVAIGYLERIKYCGACKHCGSFALPTPEMCKQCRNGSNWEWRGVKTEVDYGN